ncbi:MAG: hypothetical protein KKF44_11235 [Nanoarchaeota archaeon]|nr:hypothetical protein [Nanoarchaeota archaeon]
MFWENRIIIFFEKASIIKSAKIEIIMPLIEMDPFIRKLKKLIRETKKLETTYPKVSEDFFGKTVALKVNISKNSGDLYKVELINTISIKYRVDVLFAFIEISIFPHREMVHTFAKGKMALFSDKLKEVQDGLIVDWFQQFAEIKKEYDEICKIFHTFESSFKLIMPNQIFLDPNLRNELDNFFFKCIDCIIKSLVLWISVIKTERKYYYKKELKIQVANRIRILRNFIGEIKKSSFFSENLEQVNQKLQLYVDEHNNFSKYCKQLSESGLNSVILKYATDFYAYAIVISGFKLMFPQRNYKDYPSLWYDDYKKEMGKIANGRMLRTDEEDSIEAMKKFYDSEIKPLLFRNYEKFPRESVHSVRKFILDCIESLDLLYQSYQKFIFLLLDESNPEQNI